MVQKEQSLVGAKTIALAIKFDRLALRENFNCEEPLIGVQEVDYILNLTISRSSKTLASDTFLKNASA